jgi:hypothetical protein
MTRRLNMSDAPLFEIGLRRLRTLRTGDYAKSDNPSAPS